MPADVLLWRLPGSAGALAPADPRPGLRALLAALGGAGPTRRSGGCAVKIHLGPPGRPPAVAPAWAAEIARSCTAGTAGAAAPGAFVTDTLSIATRGLDTPDALIAAARSKGFEPGSPGAGRLPFVVADDPAGPPPVALAPRAASEPPLHLAGAVAGAARLAVVCPVRPQPHLGLAGAVATLGLELVTREAKLLLHHGIRPQVDTPLCAGCGSCLDVCLYDAIVFRGGRAAIDHQRCTGCGECMGVCFMAGIAPEASSGLAAFQTAVAHSAVAVAAQWRDAPGFGPVYLNLLIQIEPVAQAARGRRLPVEGIGVVAARDPVAADAAAFDLLYARLGGRPATLGGYPQDPGEQLLAAEAAGLGTRDYRLREVGTPPEFLD